jgi:hypothetical protein
VAKVYGVHPNTVNAWKKAFFEKGPDIFSQDSIVGGDVGGGRGVIRSPTTTMVALSA